MPMDDPGGVNSPARLGRMIERLGFRVSLAWFAFTVLTAIPFAFLRGTADLIYSVVWLVMLVGAGMMARRHADPRDGRA